MHVCYNTGAGRFVDSETLSAGFTFSLPSSREDGLIEVRNVNRFRKVYSISCDIAEYLTQEGFHVETWTINRQSAFLELQLFW